MPAPPSAVLTLAACLALIVAGACAYANSLEGVFVFDDEPAIARNSNLRELWPLWKSLAAPADTTLSGRPVATLTFAVDTALRGGSLHAYHTTNVAIHLAAALLLFGVTRRTLRRTRSPAFGETESVFLAFGVALLFVVHPLQTSAVTYLIQRVESLMALFYLATLYAAIRAADAPTRTAATLWSIASASACVLGMGTKETMVTAPILVLLWDRLFLESSRPRRGLQGALFASWLVLALLVSTLPRGASAGFTFPEWPWWRYLITQAGVLAHYIRLAFIPAPLALDYEWPASTFAAALAPMTFVALLLGGTLWALVSKKPAGFLGAAFFLILAPTSSVLPIVTEVAAEHRMYLPLAAVAAAVVLSAAMAIRRLAHEAPLVRIAGFVALLGAAAILLGMTRARNLDYLDYDRIWAETVRVRPQNSRARTNLASSLLTQGRYAEAELHLREAVRLKPGSVEALTNLGVALAAQRRTTEGLEFLSRATELDPTYVAARRNLGEALALEGRLKEAVREFEAALALLPEDVPLLNRAAWILATSSDAGLRDGSRARVYAERTLRITSRTDADALDALGAALAAEGAFPEAARVAEEGALRAASQGRSGLAQDIRKRRDLYLRGIAYREP